MRVWTRLSAVSRTTLRVTPRTVVARPLMLRQAPVLFSTPTGEAPPKTETPTAEEATNAKPDAQTTADGGQGKQESNGGAANDAEVKRLQEECSKLESRLADLEADLQLWKDTAVRERADAENARRIAKEDVASERIFAIRNFAKDLLEVPDTFEKALALADKEKLGSGEADKGGSAVGKFIDGIRGVQRSLERTLERHGVKRQVIIPKETAFDANVHEALTILPNEELPHHTITDIFQNGYVLKDRVLRAAKVVVADNPSKPASKPTGEDAK